MIKLYHCHDARSLRCAWALEELKIPYELEVLPFPPRLKAPEFLQINPAGTVPYLIDGATTLNESGAALEYIAVKYGDGALAIRPDEAAFGSWLNWIHFGEAALTTPLALTLRFTVLQPEALRQPRLGEDFTRLFLERVALVEAAVTAQDYLCDDRFTVADISVGYALFLGSRMRIASQLSPKLSAYLERLQSRPAFAAARKRQRPASQDT